ncbi:hypothetical protein BO82DRAFT_351789 [Aspergillus uvarum CBS 121591]|uniref:Uncharacterized protein n=1 Tax=Aspergillus uvarum CBS 121591 TaxID=1448315 RepID=A0A319CJF5_9EURO|nr:hypothetical protein BO82DRAFT_351789 [Aspergillus uvarum CBS 121591]PYH84580.1 hypothetical protein BO82DRAFT_351789 [Aspergillus uvarum CBS 121591]
MGFWRWKRGRLDLVLFLSQILAMKMILLMSVFGVRVLRLGTEICSRGGDGGHLLGL